MTVHVSVAAPVRRLERTLSGIGRRKLIRTPAAGNPHRTGGRDRPRSPSLPHSVAESRAGQVPLACEAGADPVPRSPVADHRDRGIASRDSWDDSQPDRRRAGGSRSSRGAWDIVAGQPRQPGWHVAYPVGLSKLAAAPKTRRPTRAETESAFGKRCGQESGMSALAFTRVSRVITTMRS